MARSRREQEVPNPLLHAILGVATLLTIYPVLWVICIAFSGKQTLAIAELPATPGFFDQIPRELEEAARLDGASRFFVFRKIALPLARPGIAVTALFAFMSAWNEFILAATFMNGE